MRKIKSLEGVKRSSEDRGNHLAKESEERQKALEETLRFPCALSWDCVAGGEKTPEKITGRKQSGREDSKVRDCSAAVHGEVEQCPWGGLRQSCWGWERGRKPLNVGQGHAPHLVMCCFLNFT